MKTLVLANQKGGVGKSAIATQLAHYGRGLGLKVIVIDLDHQRNTSRPLSVHSQVKSLEITSGELLEGGQLPDISDLDQIQLLAGDDKLTGLEKQATRHNEFATNLRNALKAFDQLDLCIIDTNPNPDIRYASALISADYALAPVQLNQEAIEGIAGLLNHPRYGLSKIKSVLNPKLEFLGILPNLVEPTPFQKNNMALITNKFGSRLLSDKSNGTIRYGFIPKRSAIAEAQAAGQFLPDLKKTAARDAWNELQPVFEMILTGMGFRIRDEVAN